MTVSAITSNASTAVDDVAQTTGAAATSTSGTTETARPRHHHHGSAKVSEMGQMMSKLQSLATSNPEEFKTLTSSIADKLTAAAHQAGGDDATRLSEMADRFRTAATEGTTDALQLPPPPSSGQRAQPYGDAAARPEPSAEIRQTFDDIFALVKNA